MNVREARQSDVEGMMQVRLSVRENILMNPERFSKADYVEYLFGRGKGWVCETGNRVIGFAVIDNKEHNVWALFVRPEFENKGIGRRLHRIMLDWYFHQTNERVWLSTSPGTRASRFYHLAGWREAGTYGSNEIKFEMTAEEWLHTMAQHQ